MSPFPWVWGNTQILDDDPADMAAALFCPPLSGLPPAVGGSLLMEEFTSWLQEEARLQGDGLDLGPSPHFSYVEAPPPPPPKLPPPPPEPIAPEPAPPSQPGAFKRFIEGVHAVIKRTLAAKRGRFEAEEAEEQEAVAEAAEEVVAKEAVAEAAEEAEEVVANEAEVAEVAEEAEAEVAEVVEEAEAKEADAEEAEAEDVVAKEAEVAEVAETDGAVLRQAVRDALVHVRRFRLVYPAMVRAATAAVAQYGAQSDAASSSDSSSSSSDASLWHEGAFEDDEDSNDDAESLCTSSEDE